MQEIDEMTADSQPVSIMKRRVVWVTLIATIFFAITFVIDGAGSKRLEREERRWRDEALQQRELLRTYRRQLVVGEPRDQNGAIWYRRAFERLSVRTAEMHRELLPLVTSRIHPGVDRLDAAYRDWCTEAESQRVRTALACTQCDWEISYDFQANPSSGEWFQALVLGECLALNGSRHLARREWADSTSAFLTTLGVASDFGQGPLEMNIVAVAMAQWAVRGFAEAISRIEDAALLDRLAEQFAQLETTMPSLPAGLAREQLSSAVQATSIARAYANDHREGFRALLPWHAVAAWRLLRQERIVSKMSLLASQSDLAERSQIIAELSQPGPLSVSIVSNTLENALRQQDQLVRAVHAAQVALILQGWYVRHGEYPAAMPKSDIPDVEYERTNQGKGYRVRTRSETESYELFLERTPDIPAQ